MNFGWKIFSCKVSNVLQDHNLNNYCHLIFSANSTQGKKKKKKKRKQKLSINYKIKKQHEKYATTGLLSSKKKQSICCKNWLIFSFFLFSLLESRREETPPRPWGTFEEPKTACPALSAIISFSSILSQFVIGIASLPASTLFFFKLYFEWILNVV